MKPEPTQIQVAGAPDSSHSSSTAVFCRLRPTRRPHGLLQLSHASLLALLVCAGCQKADKTTVTDNPVGTYSLVSVDGNQVPCTVQHEGHGVPIQSGSFVINADRTCSSKMLITGQARSIEVNATYTREGSKLTMRWAGAGTTVGTVQGETFTMVNEGMTLAYQKQKEH